VASDRREKLEARLRLVHPLAEGWLVFKSADEKRRLASIPPNWDSYRERELRELWEKADIIGSKTTEQSA